MYSAKGVCVRPDPKKGSPGEEDSCLEIILYRKSCEGKFKRKEGDEKKMLQSKFHRGKASDAIRISW